MNISMKFIIVKFIAKSLKLKEDCETYCLVNCKAIKLTLHSVNVRKNINELTFGVPNTVSVGLFSPSGQP